MKIRVSRFINKAKLNFGYFLTVCFYKVEPLLSATCKPAPGHLYGV